MKIKMPERTNVTLFENLSEGDVFEARGSYYMKIYVPTSMNNAVDLFDGDIEHFEDETEVYIVDCELVIKN